MALSFRPSGQADLAPSGVKARLRANLDALVLLRQLQADGRPASEAEQRVLARWGGWGATGVAQVLDEDRAEFAPERARLAGLLSPAEFAAARLTTLNAHYTDAALVAEIWSAVQGLGFESGRVLEPGCGSGTFIGLAPSGAQMTGVELDPTTAAIASLLYPSATIRTESFADTRFPAGHFDAAVGNVPFSDVVLHDPRYNACKLAMHNHFLVKSLELVRPGGVMAMLTSRWTMDATNPAARCGINELADLVCAFRLPSRAHWRSAGTEAVTDVLVLRRREPDRAPQPADWIATSPIELVGPAGTPEQVRINNYWQTHPEQVLGTAELKVGLHGFAGLVISTDRVELVPDRLRERLQAAVAAAEVRGLRVTSRTGEQETVAAGWVPAVTGAVDGQLVAHRDGRFAVVEDGGEVPVTVPKTQAVEVRALLELRDQARALIAAEAASMDDTPAVEDARIRLAAGWRSYVDRYGPINRFSLHDSGRLDPDTGEAIQSRRVPPAVRLVTKSTFGTLVAALEVFDDLTQHAESASLLRHRLIVPRQPVQGVDSAADGLAVVLDQLGRVDVDQIAALMGVERESAIADLGELVFQVPGADEQWQTRAHYLSGDVRTKLDAARHAELAEPGRWTRQVTGLEAVLPDPIGAGDITARLGAVWIPDTDHEQFLRDLLNNRGQVRVVQLSGSDWEVTGPSWGVEATKEWGTDRIPAPRLMSALIGQRPVLVYDTLEDKTQLLNPTETEAAQEKARLMQARFGDWVWEQPDRASRLLAEYNRRFNSTVLRDYSTEGALLTLPGLNRSFTPRAHQRTAVARMINEPAVGLFHEVGAGKTAEMIIGATELRRLGLIRKPAIVVPNNMLIQFASDWLQLYPQAKVLAASSEDLTLDNRRRFVARVATNDWDGIVLTRTAFERLSLTPDNEAAYQDRQLEQVRQRLRSVKEARGDSRGIKRLERAMLAAEQKLKAIRDVRTDPDMHFEHTGIDYLVVDELHHMKNLATVSSIPDANIAGSKRASDLHAKVDYLRHTNGERVITGATATPLANSITEMYVMQRYLDPDGLQRAGIHDFDSWAATFGEVVTAPELAVAGGGRFKVKSRFARFTNVPELLTMFHAFADVKTAADLDLPRPALQARPDGQRAPRIILVPPSPDLLDYIGQLGQRTDQVSQGAVDPTEDNMLKICGDGRKAALAMQLVNSSSPETGKIEAAADELTRVWEQTRDNRYHDPDRGENAPTAGALQIVFCDLSTPTTGRWNVYDALRDALITRGLPPGSIRFIHDAHTDAEKAKLFAACRAGHVTVLIGSTEKMGVGTNIQNRAIHLMDLDAPWRPADVAQRHGRILRQGNQNPEIAITQVVTERSFDAYMWQTLERKAGFIDQVMSGRVTRTTGDIGDATLNAAEVKALSSGNPLLLQLALAEQELARLTRLERSHATTQRTLASTLNQSEHALGTSRQRVIVLQALQQRTQSTAGDQFRITITATGHTLTDRGQAADALQSVLYRPDSPDTTVCRLGGHTLTAATGTGYGPHGATLYNTTWRIQGDGDVDLTTSYEAGKGQRVDPGTIRRLENLVASIPSHQQRSQQRVADLEHTINQAKRMIGKPFQHADQLATARTRYATLTAELAEQQQQPPTPTPAWETVTAAHRSVGSIAQDHGRRVATRQDTPEL